MAEVDPDAWEEQRRDAIEHERDVLRRHLDGGLADDAELALSCGHRVERFVRYAPPADGHRRNGWHPAPTTAALPAPTRAVCDDCSRDAESGDSSTGGT